MWHQGQRSQPEDLSAGRQGSCYREAIDVQAGPGGGMDVASVERSGKADAKHRGGGSGFCAAVGTAQGAEGGGTDCLQCQGRVLQRSWGIVLRRDHDGETTRSAAALLSSSVWLRSDPGSRHTLLVLPPGVLESQPTDPEVAGPSPRPCSSVRRGLCMVSCHLCLWRWSGLGGGLARVAHRSGERAASVGKAFLLERHLARGEKVCDGRSV